MASKLADQNRAWVEKVKLRQEVIFRSSAERLMEEANTPEPKGKMPVNFGFLRNTMTAAKDGMPTGQSKPEKGVKYSAPVNGDPGLVLLSVNVGETVWMGWTAVYALRMEHGFQGQDSLGREYSQAGKGFMRAAQQRWVFIVQEAAEQAKKDIP